MRNLLIILLLLPIVWGCRKETNTECRAYNTAEKIIVISDRFEDNYHDHMMDTVMADAPVYVSRSYEYDDTRWMIGKDSTLQNALFNKPNFVLRFPQPGRVQITMIGTKNFSKGVCNSENVIRDTLKRTFIVGDYGYHALSGTYIGTMLEDSSQTIRQIVIGKEETVRFYIKGIPEASDSANDIDETYSPTYRPISLGIDSALVVTKKMLSTRYGYWLSVMDYNTRTRRLNLKYKPFVQNRVANSGFEYQPTQTFIGYRQ
jgi:hypothetical protein